MNRKQQSVVLAGLLALALAGCSSTRGSGDEAGSGATSSGTTSSGGSSGSSGTSGSTSSGATTSATSAADTSGASMASPTQAPAAAGSAMMPAGPPNAVVMQIESLPRSSTATGAAVGGSGTAGTTGSSMGDDKMYRVTLRMDDGTTRVVTQDKAPTFRSGDRVNMMDGMIR